MRKFFYFAGGVMCVTVALLAGVLLHNLLTVSETLDSLLDDAGGEAAVEAEIQACKTMFSLTEEWEGLFELAEKLKRQGKTQLEVLDAFDKVFSDLPEAAFGPVVPKEVQMRGFRNVVTGVYTGQTLDMIGAAYCEREVPALLAGG